MNRITILLFFLLVCISSSFGEKYTIYDSERYCISLSLNSFKIWEPDISDTIGTAVNEPETLSTGFVHSDDLMILCYDTIRLAKYKFEFKKIDAYRIKVMNKTPFFKPGDILYAEVITDSIGRPVQYLSWKDGKPHGNWEYILDGGSKFVLYENGNIVGEVFKTNEEIHKEYIKNTITKPLVPR